MLQSPPLKVMVVEDQALLAMEIEYVLRELGHDVVGCATDFPSAEALAATAAPEVALVDLNLRDGPSGPRVADALHDRQGVAVIFLTANPEEIPAGLDGAVALMLKPFEPATLAEAVAFAGRYRREGRLDNPPVKLRVAPRLRDAGVRPG